MGLIRIVPYFVARGSRNTRASCTALGTARAPGEKPKTLVGSAAAGPFGQGLLCRLEPWLWLSSACWWCVHLQHRPALLPSHPQLRDHPNGGGGAIDPLAALQHSAAPIPSPPRVLRGCTAHNRDLRGCAVSWFQSRSATGCGRGGESARCSSRARPHRARCHYKQFNLELQLTVTSTEELLFFPHRKAAGMRARFQRLS